MKWKYGVFGLLMAALASSPTWADGSSSAHNLFANLARANKSVGLNDSTAVVSSTWVRGMYAISNQQGAFVGYVNEAGTLLGDSRGFNVVSTSGAPPRPMTLDEVAELRAEVMNGIDYEKLVKVPYGDGGRRKIILFTSIDCPVCKNLEEAFQKHKNGMNTTFYVVPSSLQKISNGGLQAWQAVSRIWCAEDNGAAWTAFWASRALPQPRQCQFSEPRTAETAFGALTDILKSVNIKRNGVPAFIREDGVLLSKGSSEFEALFHPVAKPQINQKPARWLVASTDNRS